MVKRQLTAIQSGLITAGLGNEVIYRRAVGFF